MSDLISLGVSLFLKDQFSAPAEKAGKNMENLDKKAKKTVSSFNKLDSAISAAAGAAVFEYSKRALGSMSKPFVDFQEGMAAVDTLIDDKTFDMQAYSERILDMSKKWGTATTDQASAAYELLSTPIANTSNSLELLEVANKIAVGGRTTATEAVDLLSTVMLSWNMTTDQAMDAADTLFMTVKGGKTNIRELSGFISQAAPVASVLGVSLEELGIAIANMTAQGTPTRVAMTQVKSALVAMVSPSEEMDKIWNALGYSSASAAIKALGMEKALTAIQVATKGDVGAMQELMGTFDGVQTVLKNTGEHAAGWAYQQDLMTKKLGSTEDAQNTIAQAQAFKNKQLAVSWEVLRIGMGAALYEAFGPAIAMMTKLVNGIDSWLDKHPSLKKVIVVTITLLAGLGMALGVVTVIMSALSLVSLPVLIIFIKIIAVIALVVGAFKLLSAALDWITGENDFLMKSMIAGWQFIKQLAQDIGLIFMEDWWPKIKAFGEGVAEIFTSAFEVVRTVIRVIADELENTVLRALSIMEKMPGLGDKAREWKEEVKGLSEYMQENPLMFTPAGWIGKGMLAGQEHQLSSIHNRANEIRANRLSSSAVGATDAAVSNISSLGTDKAAGLGVAKAPITNVIQVPQSKIESAPIMLDAKKIGEALFSMLQTATVRETTTP